MKIEKRLIHALPLAAIVGLSGLAFVGGSIQANEKTAKAESEGLSMTVNGNFEFEITPEVGGTYAEKTVNVSVSTTSRTGYSLTFGPKYSVDAETDDGEGVIESIDGRYTVNDMPLNSWGFYVGTEDYVYPIPSVNRPATIASTDSAVINDVTNVTVGVKVSPSLKSGDYKNILVFTAVANENNCEDGFFCIDTLQEMTPEICAATTTPLTSATDITFEYTTDDTKIPRTTLRDVRDGKTYLVSKYADGQCWMSQNLALDLDHTKTLTSANTDLNTVSSWTPTNDTATNINDYKGNIRYDHSYKSSVAYLNGGGYASDTPSTNDGKSEWESVGNYYNWAAATASVLPDRMTWEEQLADEESVSNSICPKGWRLPTNQYISSVGEKSDFHDLMSLYNEYTNVQNERFAIIGSKSVWYYHSDQDDYSEPTVEAPELTGSYSTGTHFWTNTNSSNYYRTAYEAWFSGGYFSGINQVDYGTGFSVRCIARGNDGGSGEIIERR